TIDGKTFTPENFVDLLEFEVERNFAIEGIPVTERKVIIGDLLQIMIDRLMALSLEDLTAAVGVLHRNLEESHILLSFRDPALHHAVLERDWGGAIRPVHSDYISIIDANLASLKTDAVMHRAVSYAIRPVGEEYEATLTMRYDHRGSFD